MTTPPTPAPKMRTTKAVTTIRTAATKAVDTTSDAARDIARQTVAGIEANPVAVLAGGIAVGLLAGSLIPRSESETKLLRPVGKRLSDTARGGIRCGARHGKSPSSTCSASPATPRAIKSANCWAAWSRPSRPPEAPR